MTHINPDPKEDTLRTFGDKSHLRDFTQGTGRHAACGTPNVKPQSVFIDTAFAEVPAGQRCKKCETELKEAQQYELTCRVCHTKFPTPESLAAHSQNMAHALQSVSYRKQRATFVVDLQSHYDSPAMCARTLAQARQELADFFPHQKFDILPGRMMLTTDRANSVLLGQAYVAEYYVVPRA